MKKILACIFAVSIISTAAFSKNFFSSRFFEIKVGADVDFSNNLFTANEYLKKDLVIDLRKIADECPKDGFNLRADAAPKAEMNLNIAGIHIGFASGVDIYESLTVGKDFFDFLGYGNSIGQTLNFNIVDDTDVFAYSQVDVGFSIGKFKINVVPALFIPIISIRGGGGSVTVLNDSDGNLDLSMNLNLDVYSAVELKTQEDGNNVSFDTSKIETALKGGYGFDLGGGVTLPLSSSFSVIGTCRIPIIPGHLNYKSNVQGGFDYHMQLNDFENAEKTERETTVTNVEEKLAVHRPLKLNLYADKNFFGTLINLRGGAGFGIRRPFCDAAVFYPEYYLGATLNLIDIFKLGVSTQYRDQLFIHQLGTTLNVRLLQFDLGISSQSASFKKSFSGAGIGAYTYVTIGF